MKRMDKFISVKSISFFFYAADGTGFSPIKREEKERKIVELWLDMPKNGYSSGLEEGFSLSYRGRAHGASLNLLCNFFIMDKRLKLFEGGKDTFSNNYLGSVTIATVYKIRSEVAHSSQGKAAFGLVKTRSPFSSCGVWFGGVEPRMEPKQGRCCC